MSWAHILGGFLLLSIGALLGWYARVMVEGLNDQLLLASSERDAKDDAR